MKGTKSPFRKKDQKKLPMYVSMEEFVKRQDVSGGSQSKFKDKTTGSQINSMDMLFIASLTVALITLVLLFA